MWWQPVAGIAAGLLLLWTGLLIVLWRAKPDGYRKYARADPDLRAASCVAAAASNDTAGDHCATTTAAARCAAVPANCASCCDASACAQAASRAAGGRAAGDGANAGAEPARTRAVAG